MSSAHGACDLGAERRHVDRDLAIVNRSDGLRTNVDVTMVLHVHHELAGVDLSDRSEWLGMSHGVDLISD
jgi:hypothetical protein